MIYVRVEQGAKEPHIVIERDDSQRLKAGWVAMTRFEAEYVIDRLTEILSGERVRG